MIWPIPPNVAAAGVKSAGSITSAIIGRYRPAGVPRTGSTEDRAVAYQRLLDAVIHGQGVLFMLRTVQMAVGSKKTDEVFGSSMSEFMHTGTEVLAALGAVKLRGTVAVIAAGEKLVSAHSELDMNEKDDRVFHAQYKAVTDAQAAFLDAARTDLGYDTKPYQLLRRRREKKFLRRQQEAAAIEA